MPLDDTETPHDVLAAEEFGVPAPVPELKPEPAHDVLAAEEFGVPAPDPTFHRGPVELPDDPTGIPEPHDVLAAEEFALPAGARGAAKNGGSEGGRGRSRVAVALCAGVALALLLRKRHK